MFHVKHGMARPPATDVPITASTVLAWAESWVQMSADEELMSGPLTDDELARRYGSSARTLRRLRKAVLSGALRQQAERLGVTEVGPTGRGRALARQGAALWQR